MLLQPRALRHACTYSRGTTRPHGLLGSRPPRSVLLQLRVAQPLEAATTSSAAAAAGEQQQQQLGLGGASSSRPVVVQSALQQDEAAAAQLEQPHLQATVPTDVLREFEHKLEADVTSVAVTLTAVTGVIIFWRGVWSLLDYFMGDSLLGDICCIVVGLSIVLWIRLSGVKVAPTFWPPS